MSCGEEYPVPARNECGGYYCSEEHGHIDCALGQSASDRARTAILLDLKARFWADDKSVKPLDPEQRHHWTEPQINYFSGSGTMKCPVCKTGKLKYSRSGYNGHVHALCSTEHCVRFAE